MIREKTLFNARFFYNADRDAMGVTEMPANFVAVRDWRVLIKGEPCKDVLQAAFAAVGFQRAHITRVGANDNSLTGLLIDVAA